MFKFLFLLLTYLIYFSIYAQQVDINNIEKVIADRLENLAMNSEVEDVDYTFLTERLSYYYRHPIPLNEKCTDPLKELQLLSNIQINAILDHIRKYGNINRIEELQRIESMSVDDILNIAPFVTGGSNELSSNNSVDKAANHHLRMRYKENIQDNKGIKESKYAGDNYSLYSRYTFNFEKVIKIGLTLEKDAGETLFPENKVSDFQSGFLQIQLNKKIRKIIIGDFKASFGQGLTFSNAGGISKSAEVLLIGKESDNITPYRSVNESGFLRGIATDLSFGNLSIRSFYSMNKADATLEMTSQGMKYTSLYQSGLHRTENEMNKVNALNFITLGMSTSYKIRELEFSVISVHRSISLAGQEQKELYNLQEKNNRNLTMSGLSMRYVKNNITVFSEISRSFSNGNAAVVGLLFMPDRKVGLSILARRFDQRFTQISSASFSERSKLQNEDGFYSGMRISLPYRISLSAYADVFSFRHPTFQSNSRGNGIDYFLQLKRKSGKDREWLIQVKQKEKPKDFSNEADLLSKQKTEVYQSIRIQFQTLLLEALRFRTRLEFSNYSIENISDQGMLMFQEIKYSELGMNWSVLCRYTLFDTETYNSRIYTYEQNVQGAYSIPSFSGKGSKIMLLFNYKFRKGFKVALKIGQLIYDDRHSIGSGYDEISGSEKTEITGQFDITF